MAQVNIDVAKEGSVQTVNTIVNSINTNTNTIVANTAYSATANKTGTLSQKESYSIGLLENATYGLNALKTAVTGGNIPVVKSVQRGTISSTTSGGTITTTISTIDTAKSFILINASNSATANASFAVVSALTSAFFTVQFLNTAGAAVLVSWQVIEFY